jgi:hypothetical protein
MDKKDRIKALAANEHSPIRTLASLEAMSDAELTNLEAHVTKKTSEVTAATTAKETRVKALVGSEHCAIKTEAALMAMSEAELTALEASVKTATDAAQATARAAQGAPAQTDEQWLKTAPASVRSLVESAQKREDTERTRLVAAIGKQTKVYTEAELKAMSVEQLTKLAAASGVEAEAVDFSGMGMPRAAEGGAQSDVYLNPPNGYRVALDAKKTKEATTTH